LDKKKLHINKENGNGYPEPDVPVEAAWDNMKQLLQYVPAVPAAKSRFRFGKGGNISPFLAGAATAITVSVISVLIYVIAIKKEKPASSQILYNSDPVPRTDTLQDGTVAYLDIHSSLSVTNPAEKDKRITLNKGGCYFRQINNNSTNRWQLQVASVAVLPNNASLYVSVDSVTGIAVVQVQSGNAEIQMGKQKLLLTTGELVQINTRQSLVPAKQKLNPNLFSYANKVFEFSNTPFKEAAGLIGKAYGVKIVLKNNNLDNCTITTRFDNKSLEEILDILGYTLSFEYKIDKKKNQVIISGDGCN
jgi:ferric-dicitrate binding protein FerR (iron transport regulator)